jgi:hypothetical protein
MDYSILLANGLAGDLNISRGSGELDHLSDDLLRDIGYRRLGGRVVKDEAPFDQPAVQRRGRSWSHWGRSLLGAWTTRHPVTHA